MNLNIRKMAPELMMELKKVALQEKRSLRETVIGMLEQILIQDYDNPTFQAYLDKAYPDTEDIKLGDPEPITREVCEQLKANADSFAKCIEGAPKAEVPEYVHALLAKVRTHDKKTCRIYKCGMCAAQVS